ncbi:LOW QUALITY PROTEIN: cell division control protein 6 homolog [Drosophila sulfurigaster albostrigata]|uniref:LOW QUALITY PROTEIN: cell division control protein 6 homolog n=1 Tax=Drosophila sulfurigaster albostrigata TaxID=89887 RepID=UPI002D21BB76|nr:LOW QUALITY PROTEIN: cell division control protein 6 homolog [Drosophila sulfurigaster albostrigata]
MAAVRRSTRLSSISKSATPAALPQSPMATTPRRSEVWRRRQTKQILDSDDEDKDDIISVISENNENSNLLNKMDKVSSNRRKVGAATKLHAEQPKTPRSSKKTTVTKNNSCGLDSMAKRIETNIRAVKMMDECSSDEEQELDDTAHVSPPKQRKLQPLPQHLISPSRLLDRLSIDEREEEQAEKPKKAETKVRKEPKRELKQEKQKEPKEEEKQELKQEPEQPPLPSPPRNKYQNARRVLNSAETLNLPGREEQLQELREFFSSHLDTQTSGSLYVSGQPGTGKTACLSMLLRAPEYAQRLQRVYINCTSIASVGAVYKKLCMELQLKPAGRTERDHLEAIQRHLRKAKRMLLLVLDEIDQLCTTRQEVLYTIFEWPALPGARILLVGIANSLDLTDRALMRLNARCELKPRLMHFPPYTKPQIVEIFKSRLAEAQVLDVFPPVTLQLLAAKVSAVSGDVRRALDIGRRVVEIAEQQKCAGEKEFNMKALELDGPPAEETLKPVQVSQVAAVLNKVYGASQNLEEDIEEAFPLQQKLMLCSLVLMLRNERNKDISVGRLHEVYRRVCSKRNILALDQAEFAGTVDLVETRGILRVMRKKEPRLNKVLLQWDEEEVHAALSDKQLIASILSDTACLAK